MVDIETLGTKSNSVILAIAAVEFNIDSGETGKEFKIGISVQDCLNHGLLIEGDTLIWWMKQNDDARMIIVNDHASLVETALDSFDAFCSQDYQVWGNSASFDLGLLGDAYAKLNRPIPWKFYNERCVRTLVALEPEIKKNHVFKGISHNAIDDCKNQIAYCSEIWNIVLKKD